MKRVFALVLTLVILFSLAACGQKESKEIVIGNIQDLSGATSVWGNAVKNGAELAVKKINEQGGIDGRKIKLISYDVKLDPQEAINAYKRLVDQDKAVAVLGPPISNIGLSLAPVANSKKVPVVGSFIDPRVTTKEDGTPQPYMFLMQPSSVQYAEILASYTINELGIKNVAVMYDQSNAFSVSLIKPFTNYVENHGGKVVIEQIYKKGDKDFKTQLSKIKESGAEALYFPNYVQDCVLAVQQSKQIGLDIPFIGGLDFAPPFIDLLNDPLLADNIYFANNFSESEPQLKEVYEAYKEKYGEVPINKAYLGYDKILIIKDAIERAGKADPVAIKEALEKTQDLPATTGDITISPDTHRPVGLSMVMYKIEKGVYKDLGRHVPKEHLK